MKYLDFAYERVFQRMLKEAPYLLIPIVNEGFGTQYEFDADVVLRKGSEYHAEGGEVILDSNFIVNGTEYHYEFQRHSDGAIVLKIIEYNFVYAMKTIHLDKKEKNVSYIDFPKSCVFYLRQITSPKERIEKILVTFPDNTQKDLRIPVIHICDYSLEQILEKKLYFFLPFYMIHYEDAMIRGINKELLLQQIDLDFQKIESDLVSYFVSIDLFYCYKLLNELIEYILIRIIEEDDKFKSEVELILEYWSYL